MRRVCMRALLLLLMLAGRSGSTSAAQPPKLPEVFEVVLHDTVQPISMGSLEHAITVASQHGGAALIVNLSTPGGLPNSADEMVRMIRSSPVPVLVFAGMPNTRVGGEGIRVLAAGAVAAMVRDTYLTPLSSDPPRYLSKAERAAESYALTEAVANLSRMQGRNPALAESVSSGMAWVSAEKAKSDGLIDVVAEDETALMGAVQGRTVTLGDGRRVRLNLSGATVTVVSPTMSDRLMRALMNPDFSVLLLTLGGLLLYLEFNTPGTVLPGGAGLLLVLLAMYALHLLPLRRTALLLLAVSGILLLLETRFARHGILATIGVCLLPVGLATLVAGPIRELEVGWATAVGAGLGFGGVTAMLVLLGMQARRAKRRTGAEAMLGWLAIAQTPLAPDGRVLVRGELWNARLSSDEAAVDAGSRVRVLRAEGPVLEVTAIGRVSSG